MPSKHQSHIRGNPKNNREDHYSNRCCGRAQRASQSWWQWQRFEIRISVVQYAIPGYVLISDHRPAAIWYDQRKTPN